MNLAKRVSRPLLAAATVSLLVLMGCATLGNSDDPQDAFWASLSSHCGKAYAGRM